MNKILIVVISAILLGFTIGCDNSNPDPADLTAPSDTNTETTTPSDSTETTDPSDSSDTTTPTDTTDTTDPSEPSEPSDSSDTTASSDPYEITVPAVYTISTPAVNNHFDELQAQYEIADEDEQVISYTAESKIYSPDGKTLWCTLTDVSSNSATLSFSDDIEEGVYIKKGSTVTVKMGDESSDDIITIGDNTYTGDAFKKANSELLTYIKTGLTYSDSQKNSTWTIADYGITVIQTEIIRADNNGSKTRIVYEFSPSFYGTTKIEHISIATGIVSRSSEEYLINSGGDYAGTYKYVKP